MHLEKIKRKRKYKYYAKRLVKMKTPKLRESLRRKVFGTGNKRLKTMRKFLGPKALGVGVLAYAGSVVYKKKKEKQNKG
tara:strand:+ start:275 stop:511 length:237 start_codon:yes stop_codon:yes gene_type:complete